MRRLRDFNKWGPHRVRVFVTICAPVICCIALKPLYWNIDQCGQKIDIDLIAYLNLSPLVTLFDVFTWYLPRKLGAINSSG
ncbi:hypothetical protein Sde_2006 [Saccharophagus degradans 2-40]|uniref:Uncharacterized protein n=1 Tax=Saccharophagus degradans (strain 2-40 / ATCC 43961 / DSM 17024) TaxID=203122 RepID=Q21J63_SACD2|nr:hypothetical protein Sde_2006 [Saccharophagus degradans 2-40]